MMPPANNAPPLVLATQSTLPTDLRNCLELGDDRIGTQAPPPLVSIPPADAPVADHADRRPARLADVRLASRAGSAAAGDGRAESPRCDDVGDLRLLGRGDRPAGAQGR